jgi:hypothetical protein
MRIFIVFIFLLAFLSPAFAQFTDAQKTDLAYKNEMTNPGSELGKKGWSRVGSGTFTIDSSVKLRGKSSFKLVSSAANDYLLSPTFNCKNGPNCLTRFWYKTSASTWTASVYRGANLISRLALPSRSEFSPAEISFVANDPTENYTIRITDSTSGSTINVDDVFVGRNDNIGSIDLGATQYDLTVTGTNWTTRRAVAFVYETKDNKWRAAINIMGTLSSLTTVFTGTISGMTFKNVSGVGAAGQALSSYLADVAVADRATIKARADSNASTFIVSSASNFDTIQISGDVELESKPTWAVDTVSEQVVRADVGAVLFAGYHDGDCTWARTGNAGYGDFGVDASCSFGTEYNKNFTSVTSIAGTLPGISFVAPRVGAYEICAEFTARMGGASTTGHIRMIDGVRTYGQIWMADFTSFWQPFSICGFFEFNDITTTRTVKLQGRTDNTNMTLLGASDGKAIRWTIKNVSQSIPMPQIINSVATTLEGQTVLNSAVIAGANINTKCSASPCSVYSTTGDWVSSATRSSPGNYTINISGKKLPEFSSCVASSRGDWSGAQVPVCSAIGGASSVGIYCQYNGSYTDTNVTVVCHGIK